MRTSQIVAAYNAIAGSKLTKMNGEGKIKVVKIIKALKPVATDYEDFRKEALERLKKDDFEAMAEKVRKWEKEGEDTTLTATEKAELNQYFADYQMEVDKCLKEEAEKDHDLSFTKLTDDEFQQYAESNDFTAGQLNELMDLIC